MLNIWRRYGPVNGEKCRLCGDFCQKQCKETLRRCCGYVTIELHTEAARPLTPEQREAQVDYVHTNFDYDVMLDRYEEVYHHVIGDPLKEIPSQAKAHRKAAAAQGGAA